MLTSVGEALSLSVGRQIVVSGHADDTRASITLQGATFQQNWVAQGSFLFEGVALRISDTMMELRATIEGLVPHVIPFTVRRAFPSKQVAGTRPDYAPRVEYGSQGTPFVSAMILDERDNVEGVGLRAALQSVSRNVPTLFSYDADADTWRSLQLSPPDYLENEMAKAGIRRLAAAGHNVPLNGQYPESVRALRSLEDYVATLGQDTPRQLGQFGASALTLLEGRQFGSPHHAVSHSAPLVALRDEDQETVGVAFVIASQAGREAVAQSARMQRAFEPLYRGRFLSGEFDSDQILAGNLFFARANATAVHAVERVADNVWCVSLTARMNPATAQPAILALEVAPDLGGDGRERPRSRLSLFQRRADGSWQREAVLGDRPVLDADLAFTAGGLPHVVAALAGDDTFKAHLVHLNRRDNWIPQPIIWSLNSLITDIDLDLGMWPRIVLDDTERPVVGFTFYAVGTLFQMVGVLDQNRWRVARVARCTMSDLAGTPAFALDSDVPNDLLVRGGLFFGLNYADWAPSLAVESPQKLWYAFGKGVLRLAEIDADSLDIAHVRLDVDRATGFSPAIAVRRATPTVVYKDCFGGTVAASGQVFTSRSDVHFLIGGQGLAYPGEPALPSLSPIFWRRSERSVFMGAFGEHTPLTCQVFLDAAGEIVIAIIIDAINLAARRPSNVTRDVVLRLSDKFLPSLLMTGTIDVDFLADPRTLTLSLINDRFPQDEIERIEITLRDSQAPTVRAVERSGRSPACGLDQKTWDALGVLFTGINLDPATLLGNTSGIGLERARLTGMRLSMRTEGGSEQQGGVRFTLTIPNIAAEGSKVGVGWSARSTQPSEFSFVLAPYISDGDLRWYIREAHGRVGHIDVDVELVFSWVGLVALLTLGLFPVILIADPISDSFFTDLANERRQGFQIGGLSDLVRQVYDRFSRALLFVGPSHTPASLDSVFFRSHVFTGLFRTPPPEVFVPQPAPLNVLPDPALTFGEVVVGSAPVERRFLLANDGALPLVVNDAAIRPPSADFRISSSHAWPLVLDPGAFETVTVAFTPRLPVGDRSATLEVRVQNAATVVRTVRARAGAPTGPVLVLSDANDPARLFNFGLATVGNTRTAYVELANRGAATVTINALTIEADAQSGGVFAVAPAAPFPVPAGESRFLELTFVPTATIAQGHSARLIVDSNHPTHPRHELRLAGRGVAPTLLVSPAALNFGTTTLGRSLSVTLYNTGAASLRIAGDSFRFLDAAGNVSASFQLLDGGQPVPLVEVVIQAGLMKLYTVQFRPLGPGQHDARMSLRSNDPVNPVVELNVTGRGV